MLLEVFQDGVDVVEGLVDLLPDLGTGQDNFSGNEDEENDLRLHHSINETLKKRRTGFKLVTRDSSKT